MDKFQENFCALGCLCSGLLLVIFAFLGQDIVYQGTCIPFPIVIQGVVLGKFELCILSAICLGVQTHCYEVQKWLFTKLAKAL